MYKKIKIESEVNNLRIVEKTMDDVIREIGITQDCYGKILVSTLEAVKNSIVHGNHSDPEKFVDVVIGFKNNELKIRVKDEGAGFIPEEIPDPTMPENIEALSGRGVFLMSHLADRIKFNKKGNTVTMFFNIIIS